MHSSLSSSERDDDVAFAKDQRCDAASVSHSGDDSQKQIVMTYPYQQARPLLQNLTSNCKCNGSILSGDLWNVKDCQTQ